MNELTVFNNERFGQLRTVMIDGTPWAVGIDVCTALGYAKPRDAIATHVDDGDAVKYGVIDNLGRTQETLIVNESGIYSLIFGSTKPEAKEFKRWVTSEVLPSIRKTGTYTNPKSQSELILMMAQSNVEMEKRVSSLEEKVENAVKMLSKPSGDTWASDMDERIKDACEENRTSLLKAKGKLYKELEQKANVNLKTRKTNLSKRKMKNGSSYKDAHTVTKLDAVAEDKTLRSLFEAIVREWQATLIARSDYEQLELAEVV